ncbi:MAG: hypothetical protein JNJ61_17755 [Anaerolineae bacterium]|nr:hypothetical protein [Anaerolineae bacterium]
MSDADQHDALRALQSRWQTRATEAARQAEKHGVGGTHRANYYKGIADGLKVALQDLSALLDTPTAAASPAVPAETYLPVSPETAQAALEKVGISGAELHPHKDHTFSAILSAFQSIKLSERAEQLEQVAGLVVLEYGRLPDSNKAFIDFAFKEA